MPRQMIYDDLTLKQFLRLPEAKPALEYIDGKVVRKVAPKRSHSVLATLLCTHMIGYSRPRKLGLVYIELRCTFGGRSLVPDLCFIPRGRIPRGPDGDPVDDIFFAPDLVIEMISPGQTVKNLLARLTWCVRNGVRLAWLIQPSKRRVFLVRSDRAPEILENDAALSGADVLPEFELPLTELFGWLSED
jgi:Uma2 family endonuclease